MANETSFEHETLDSVIDAAMEAEAAMMEAEEEGDDEDFEIAEDAYLEAVKRRDTYLTNMGITLEEALAA